MDDDDSDDDDDGDDDDDSDDDDDEDGDGDFHRFLFKRVHLLEDRDKWWVALLQNDNCQIFMMILVL